MTYAELLRPASRGRARLYDFTLVLTGSFVIALLAQLNIPLPFTPVPVTGQTLGVLLIPALLGGQRGAAAVTAYLLEGLSGLPFFAGGSGGFAIVAGPTGGYLLGFVVAAWLVGILVEKGWDRRFGFTLLLMVLANLVIYAIGAAWLSGFVPAGSVLDLGVYPFLPGGAFKILLATLLLPSGWKLMPAFGIEGLHRR